MENSEILETPETPEKFVTVSFKYIEYYNQAVKRLQALEKLHEHTIMDLFGKPLSDNEYQSLLIENQKCCADHVQWEIEHDRKIKARNDEVSRVIDKNKNENDVAKAVIDLAFAQYSMECSTLQGFNRFLMASLLSEFQDEIQLTDEQGMAMLRILTTKQLNNVLKALKNNKSWF